MTELTSITVGQTPVDDLGNPVSALIHYDHIEDGFDSPSRRNQVTTEIWGDADPSNGFAPGFPADELFQGDVIILENISDPGVAQELTGQAEPGDQIVGFTSTQNFELNYSAGDRIRSDSGLVMSRAGWNDGSSTLLAGATEVADTSGAGSSFLMPIGEDLSPAPVPDSFEYVGASIMAIANNTTVTLPDGSTVVLNAGETHFINGGIMVNDAITATRNIQVNLIAGEDCTTFEGRWFRISPTRLFDTELYTPVNGAGVVNTTTGAFAGASALIFNPTTAAITVQIFDQDGLDGTISVPAGSTVEYLTNNAGSGYQFITPNGEAFYVTQIYGTSDTSRDWGLALLGLEQLSPVIQAGLAIGVDPTSGNTTTIASPIWVTPIWSSTDPEPASVQLCVDWNGDGGLISSDPTNPDADTFDTSVSLGHLDNVLLDESESPPTNDLTGTKVFVCNPGNPTDPDLDFWLLTGAWGQDTSGPGGSPSIDVGTGIFNLPVFRIEKGVTLVDDDNNNGIIDVGDTIGYIITVTNESSIPIRANQIKIWDNLPAGLDYIEDSTFISPELAPFGGPDPEQIPDDNAAADTAFPLDDADDTNLVLDDPSNPNNDGNDDGVFFNRRLNGFETIEVTFLANILQVPPNNKIVNVALVTDGRFVRDDSVEFEIPELASIGDRVWLDEDGDGIQDAGEDGIPGVPVTLTYTTQSDTSGPTTITLETITDADGGYLFRDLPVLPVGETYTVTITPPTGMDPTFEEDGSLNSTVVLVSDPFSTDSTNPLAIQPGEEHTTTDFGLNWVPPANTDNNTGVGAIGDRIWSDANGDGVQDPGEAGLEGVTVNLFTDDDGDGVYDTPAGTTTTDSNGNYIFDDLDPNAYVVVVDDTTLPAGVTQSGDPDDFGTTPLNPDNQTTTPIVLAPGDVYVNADFGYTGLTNTIGDTVWLDGNGDGIVDAGEPGFEGVSVVLLADIDGDGIFDDVVATTNTDENGNYSFTGLPDGDYQVWVNDAGNVLREFNQISDPDGAAAPLDARTDVSVAGGVTVDTADFGYAPPDADADEGLIGDTVFLDTNGNGVADPGEGIEGVRLEIFDEFGRLVGITVTNENGQYAFGDLNATSVADDGEYTVVLDQSSLPAGLTQTVDPDGNLDSSSSTPLGDGEQIYTIDFGYVPIDPASLSGTIWEDTNADGVLDAAEADRFEAVTIVLTETVSETIVVTDPVTFELVEVLVTSERVVAMTTTDSSGNYSFDNLPAGDYTVRVTDDDNIVGGYWHSDAPTAGTDGQSQNDEGYQVTLAAGGTDTTADFGYYIDPGLVGNFIWQDDGDGIQQAGEPGLAGVEVTMTITYPGGVEITLVTLTSDGATDVDGDGVVDPIGFYSFGNLLLDEDYNGDGAGTEPTYDVSVDTTSTVNQTALAGLIPTLIEEGTDIQVDSNDPAGSAAQPVQGQTDVSLTNDTDPAAGIDFGFQQGGDITGTVAEDTTGDDLGDTPLTGVTVQLFADDGTGNPTGTALATVTTANGTTDDLDGDGVIDPAGFYAFTDLPFGDYVVVQTNVAGYIDVSDQDASNDGDPFDTDTTVDNQIAVTLDANDASGSEFLDSDNNFVDSNFGSIGDFVWIDTDGDGVQDAGEEGINGVTVNLLNALGAVVATTTTTNNPTTGEPGYYLFEGVSAGQYEVEFASPTGFTFSPTDQTTDDLDSDANPLNGRTGLFTLAAGENNTDIDAGLVPGGSIGDHIWLDTDGDGVDDIGEQGLPGVTVELTGTTSAGVTVTLSTITDVNGDYLFDNLPPGDYTVTVTDTNGKLTDLETSPGNTGSEVVTLLAGQDFLDADFGYVPLEGTAVIGDTVWNDVDGDGLQDPGEVGIGNVTLDLIDDTGSVVDTVTTDADGNYLFTSVVPGDYTVVVTDTNAAIDDAENNVTSGPQSPGSLTSNPITVNADDIFVDADFGFTSQPGSTIADRVWYDADGDGVQGTGEVGIAGVTIDLLDSNGVIIASVVTDSDGNFEFNGLPDGDYTIDITDDDGELTGYFPTTPPASALQQTITALAGDIINQDPTQASPVITGSGDGHPSFGFNQPGVIGDTIWNDANGDGVQDPGEGGLAGVTVTLTDSTGATVATATTDANGEYLFTNVPAGTDYVVTVDANNFSVGGALEGYSPTFDADGGNDDQSTLSIADGQSNLNQDFGYRNTDLPDISGTVFYDVDTDGTHEPDGNDTINGNTDDEPGIAGVTIDLVDSNGIVVATTVTDANGDYTFPGVPPADYTVAVTDTSGVLNGYTLTSGLDILPVSETDLTAGDVTDVDFGYVDDEQTAAITSGLWIDSDGDGVRDADETPIANVDIDLIDCGPDAQCGTPDDTVVGTATTDIDGNVIFPDLPPGLYSLDADETDTDFPSDISEITNYSTGFNDPNDPISLSEGETYDADFGYEPDAGTAGLSGTLWNDSEPDGSDGDGIQDASESGLGGITIELVDTATGITMITTTAPDGSYEFTGLTPCPTLDNPCYSLTYSKTNVNDLGLDGTEPTNTMDLNALDGSTVPDGINDDIYLINLQDGEFKEDHDFGFDAPVVAFGNVEGYVYYDTAPSNADRDVGLDPGIESVTINLVDSNGDVVATTTTSDGFTDVDGDGVIDPAGFYSFTNLVPGDYTVVVTDNNNALLQLNPTENPTGVSPVLIVEVGITEMADFGYASEQNLGNIGSLIWFDVGGPVSSGGTSDGIFDPEQGDIGLSGVTVECWVDVDGDETLTIAGVDNLVRTVTTDENGQYFCEGLPTAGYLVRVTDDKGVLLGSTSAELPAGGSLGPDGIAGTTDDIDEVNKMAIPLSSIPLSGPSEAWYIETGSDNLTADFAITGTNSLSGTVFEETAGTTADGLLNDTDVGVGSVTVTILRAQPDGTFVPFTMTTTAADGTYDFIGLPDGNYQVVVDTNGSSINGYGQTADPDANGGAGGFCSSADAAICDDTAGSVTPIELTGGSVVEDVDFGYQTEFVTTPITLGYFHAQSLGGNGVEIKWQTVTEVANIGFNLYVREKGTGWHRINDELIEPAGFGDSFDVREYSHVAYGVNGKRFALGDVDVSGKETLHGPFKLDAEAGVNRADRKVTDWKKIKSKRKAKAEARKTKRKAKSQRRLKKKLNRIKSLESKNNKRTKKVKTEKLGFIMDNSYIKTCKKTQCIESQYSEVVLNSESPKNNGFMAKLFASALSLMIPISHASEIIEPAIDTGILQFETTEEGLYRVNYSDLLKEGIDLQGMPNLNFSLTNNGDPVYVRVWGQAVGERNIFGPGGGFEFVAEKSKTLYSKSNIYTLHIAAPRSFRKIVRSDRTRLSPTGGAEIDYYQETYELDLDSSYSTMSPNNDPWFAIEIRSNGNEKQQVVPFIFDNYAAGKGVVETTVDAWGITTNSHEVSISFNGQLIDEEQFNGVSTVKLTGQIPPAGIVNGLNTYTLTIPGRGVTDHLAFDRSEVNYPRWTVANENKYLEFEATGEVISMSGFVNRSVRVFRESSNGLVNWIAPGSMVSTVDPSDGTYTIKFPGTSEMAKYSVSVITNTERRKPIFKTPVTQDDLLAGSAEYLIISHPDFIDVNMNSFVAAKQAQGYSVKVADVEAIYTVFGNGHFGAKAIQDYIRWSKENLSTEMVLLVGDDMFDYHQNQYPDAISFIPSPYAQTSSLVNIAPVDSKYVDFDDDDIPDMPIGRFIPRTTDEWAAMVNKSLNYSQHPNPGSIVISADGYDAAQQYDFSADADEIINALPTSWRENSNKIYIDELGITEARIQLLQELQSGPAVTAFVGHSGPRDWTFAGLLKSSDVTALSNAGSPTIVTQWGCWNTYYASPNGSLANEFMRNPNGGAAAVLGAIALTEAEHEKMLAAEVNQRLFQPGLTIGEAVLQAKQAYALNHPVSTNKDVILGWTLLADPALVVQQ